MKACVSIWPCGRGECSGLSGAMVSGRSRGGGLARLAPPAETTQDDTAALQFADVFRAAHAELDQAPPAALSIAVCAANCARHAAGFCICAPLRELGDRGLRARRQAYGAGDR